MAWRGAASRTVLAAVRRPAPSFARAFRAPPPVAAPRARLPSAFANFSSPLAAARPLAAMMGSPLTAAAVQARLTAHPAASARACCELSQGGGTGSFNFQNFVQGNPDEYQQSLQKKKRNFVHVLVVGNKTFVTVTDAKGNKKTGASAGSLEDRKGRSRLSRYAAEATAEQVGRSARKMGLKSVIIKVKGTTFFKKKKKVILGWSSGFRGERVRERSPVMYIHDVTQLPHNGCRLPKKRST